MLPEPGAVDDDVDVCSLFGRMLAPVQVFDQTMAHAVVSAESPAAGTGRNQSQSKTGGSIAKN